MRLHLVGILLSEERGKDLAPDLCKALITFVGSVAAPRVAMQCSPLGSGNSVRPSHTRGWEIVQKVHLEVS